MSENPQVSHLGDQMRAYARVVPPTLRAHAERMAVEADSLAEELARARSERV